MPKFNDINLREWQDSEVWTDSLWIINERDKSGKHSNFYHGNFVPQIPHQLILRYTKEKDLVFDPFIGSGTTVYECERLNRMCVGIDIQKKMVDLVQQSLDEKKDIAKLYCGDSSKRKVYALIEKFLFEKNLKKVDLAILHPPYADIIKFSDLDGDLSNAKSLKEFILQMKKVLIHTLSILKKEGYLVIVMGDKYTKGQWIPLGFHCMNIAQKLGLTLKSVVVKNMEGNRAKRSKEGIWRYRALSSDYYIFKHEYIFVFKNDAK